MIRNLKEILREFSNETKRSPGRKSKKKTGKYSRGNLKKIIIRNTWALFCQSFRRNAVRNQWYYNAVFWESLDEFLEKIKKKSQEEILREKFWEELQNARRNPGGILDGIKLEYPRKVFMNLGRSSSKKFESKSRRNCLRETSKALDESLKEIIA